MDCRRSFSSSETRDLLTESRASDIPVCPSLHMFWWSLFHMRPLLLNTLRTNRNWCGLPDGQPCVGWTWVALFGWFEEAAQLFQVKQWSNQTNDRVGFLATVRHENNCELWNWKQETKCHAQIKRTNHVLCLKVSRDSRGVNLLE